MSNPPDNSGNSQGSRVPGRPRLSHKKSRRGCLRCKARRIKCDENHPVCTPCTRHNVSCEWPVEKALKSNSKKTSTRKRSSKSADSGTPESSRRRQDNSDSSTPVFEGKLDESCHLLELRLFHQFSTVTCKTLPGANIDQIYQAWANRIPIFALEYNHKNLLYSIFAFAAFHLADTYPERDEFKRAFHQYCSRCFEEQDLAVASLTASNADSVILSCTLISILTFRPQHEGSTIVSLPLRVISANSGGRTFRRAWTWVVNNPESIAGLIVKTIPHYIEALLESITFDPKDNRLIYPADIIAEPFKHLLDPRVPERQDWESEAWDDEIERAYSEALSHIGAIYHASQASEPEGTLTRRIMGFSPMLSDRFIELLRDGEPRALVVIAHYYALIKQFENIWWIKDTAYREVMEIYGLLPPEWQTMMRWPLEMLGIPASTFSFPSGFR